MSQKAQTRDFPSWLNDEFLLEAVKRGEDTQDTELLSQRVTLVPAVGNHYVSTMYTVEIRARQNAREKAKEKYIHLLIKTLPKGKASQKLVISCEAFSREIKMFRETLPAVRDLFEKKKCSDCEDIGARYYYHTPDNTTLVVENLTPKGFKMVQRQVGLDLDHSMLVMKLLAKYHAATIALRCDKPDLIESYPKHVFAYDSSAARNSLYSTLKILSKIVQSWPNGETYSKRLLEKTRSFPEEYLKIMDYDPKGYNVLIHGDLWMGNVLFGYDGLTNEVKEVKFVDFQMSCLNSPAIDLQYFIYTSLKEEVRAAQEETLLREYHRVLCETLTRLGHQDKGLSFEALLAEYRRKELQSVFAMLVVLPILMTRGISKRLNDTEGDSGLYNRLTNEYVMKLHKKYVPIFIDKGLL